MKNDMQEKMVQLQIMETNLKALQERSDILTERIAELESTRNSIEELKSIKPSSALIPIGSGNFVPGRIDNTEDVIVGIGGGVAIKKKREDALVILDNTMKEFNKNLDEMRNHMTGIALGMERLQGELEKLQK